MSPPRHAREGPEDTRRAFLKSAINGLAVLFGLLVSAAAVLSLLPPRRAGRREERILLGEEEDAPRRGAREMTYTYSRGGREVAGKIILVRSPEGLIALSPSCTHLGCFVVWREEEGEFLCPCHGGRYDRTGQNIAGPPPRPLPRFPLEREKGKLYLRVPV